jgi:hypothetical protein
VRLQSVSNLCDTHVNKIPLPFGVANEHRSCLHPPARGSRHAKSQQLDKGSDGIPPILKAESSSDNAISLLNVISDKQARGAGVIRAGDQAAIAHGRARDDRQLSLSGSVSAYLAAEPIRLTPNGRFSLTMVAFRITANAIPFL